MWNILSNTSFLRIEFIITAHVVGCGVIFDSLFLKILFVVKLTVVFGQNWRVFQLIIITASQCINYLKKCHLNIIIKMTQFNFTS